MNLLIKLIKLDERGKAKIPPCHIESHLDISLTGFIETFRFSEPHAAEMQTTVSSLLQIVSEMFGCPLGFCLVNFQTAESTKEQLFDLERGATAVDWTLTKMDDVPVDESQPQKHTLDYFDLEHRYNLIERFHEDALIRRTAQLARGEHFDITEAIVASAQLAVIGWLLHNGDDDDSLYNGAFADDASRFDATIERLEAQYNKNNVE